MLTPNLRPESAKISSDLASSLGPLTSLGSTTGYTTEMMKINMDDARRQGYASDSTVRASDVPAGRPYPYMCLQNVMNLGASSVDACVKADDTTPGIEEGLNAGMWTVGLAMSGNEIGLLRRTRRRSPPPIARAAASARTRGCTGAAPTTASPT